jgi:hypothetical protein
LTTDAVEVFPCLAATVLLSAGNAAKIGDVGLARFMAADYMSAQAAVGKNSSLLCITSYPLLPMSAPKALRLLCKLSDIMFR